jgi:hypothetical protein
LVSVITSGSPGRKGRVGHPHLKQNIGQIPPPPWSPAWPGSSRQAIYRLNRAGDRDFSCALHTIVLTRLQHDPATRAYAARRTARRRAKSSAV